MMIEERKLNLLSKYYLFDPNPKSRLYLTNLMNSNRNIKYYDIAISNENSKKIFYLNNFFAPAGSSLGKVLKSDKKWNLSRKIFVQFFKMFKLEKIKDFSEFEAKTATLDSFCEDNNIEKIDILKIDVEGTEIDILEGAKEMMSKKLIKIIYTEVIDRKKVFQKKKEYLINFLRNYNFELINTYPIKSTGIFSDTKAEDILFKRNEINQS